MNYMLWLWLGAMVVFGIVEALTAGLVSIWFVAGSAGRGLGDSGKVTETIDNENSAGAVYVDGKTWTARSADGGVIPAGAVVKIVRMEGVKLFVEKMEEKMEVMS